MEKSKITFLVFLLFTFFIFSPQITAQIVGKYAYGKIVLKSGTIIEGKNLVLTSTEASMDVSGVGQTYELSEINQIMKRSNNAQKGCIIGAGGCAALGLLSYVVGDDETFKEYYDGKTKSEAAGQYFLGLALWTGCFGGLGYLIGKASDKWEIVYVSAEKDTGLNDYLKPQYPDYISPSLVLGRYIEDKE